MNLVLTQLRLSSLFSYAYTFKNMTDFQNVSKIVSLQFTLLHRLPILLHHQNHPADQPSLSTRCLNAQSPLGRSHPSSSGDNKITRSSRCTIAQTKNEHHIYTHLAKPRHYPLWIVVWTYGNHYDHIYIYRASFTCELGLSRAYTTSMCTTCTVNEIPNNTLHSQEFIAK